MTWEEEIAANKATLNEALDIIRKYLRKPYVGKALWHVLAAMRGPDNMDESSKLATVGVIRAHVLLDTPNPNGLMYSPDEERFCKLRREMAKDPFRYGIHFVRHMEDAFDSLGLTWSAVNPAPRSTESKKPWYFKTEPAVGDYANVIKLDKS